MGTFESRALFAFYWGDAVEWVRNAFNKSTELLGEPSYQLLVPISLALRFWYISSVLHWVLLRYQYVGEDDKETDQEHTCFG